MAKVRIGSARSDERGKLTGGKAGDQTGREVSEQAFYVHRKGWYVIRPKSATHAEKIAERMRAACNNANLGYDQSNRLGVIRNGIDTKIKTECDCSALVRACVKEATGKDPGNFTTANERSALGSTKLFEPTKSYKSGMELCTGDILVTKTKGHTVVVTEGVLRSVEKVYEMPVDTLKKGMSGDGIKWLQQALNKKGYNLTVDGVFGNATEKAVKDFQTKMLVDGIVGTQTKTLLTR